MNIGIRLHDCQGNTLEDRLSHAREQGFSCAHVALSKTIPGFQMSQAPSLLKEDLAHRVRSAMDAHRMQIAVLGCYLNVAVPDEKVWQETLEIYRAHLAFASEIGALCVGTETGAPNMEYATEPACWTEEALDLFVRRFEPIVRYAEEYHTLICLEPVCRHIVSTPERTEKVLKRLDSPHLKVILDWVNLLTPENFSRSQEVLEECIQRFGDRIVVLHMKDCVTEPGAEDLGHLSRACGTGSLSYDRILRFALSREGIPMTLEDTTPINAEKARVFLENTALTL